MLKELLQRKTELEEQIAALKQDLGEVMFDIQDLLALQLQEVRFLQAKETGSVHITVDGVKITETVPKRVEWDQDKLAELFAKIMQHGDKPFNYMRMELTVPEKLYDAMAPGVQDLFTDARTIKYGKPTYKFEVIE